MLSRDVLMVVFSVTLIAWAYWPSSPDQQRILVSSGQGVREFVLPFDDPRLAAIRREIVIWNDTTTTPELAVAKWCYETAEFYEQRSQSASIVQVSYQAGGPPEDSDSWSSLKEAFGREVNREQKKLDHRRRDKPLSPVSLAGSVPGQRYESVFWAAPIIGLLAGFVWGGWVLVQPSIRSFQVEPVIEAENDRQIRVDLPREWITIHQPVGVWLRRFLQCILGFAAVAIFILENVG